MRRPLAVGKRIAPGNWLVKIPQLGYWHIMVWRSGRDVWFQWS